MKKMSDYFKQDLTETIEIDLEAIVREFLNDESMRLLVNKKALEKIYKKNLLGLINNVQKIESNDFSCVIASYRPHFRCRFCGSSYIVPEFFFCPICGVRLIQEHKEILKYLNIEELKKCPLCKRKKTIFEYIYEFYMRKIKYRKHTK